MEASVYRWVVESAESRGVALRELGESDRPEPSLERRVQTFGTRVAGMHHWCRINEHIVIERPLVDARVLAGFQRMSRVRPVVRRYARLTETASSVLIVGEPDWAVPLPRATLVGLPPKSPLAAEWFLVVQSASYQSVIAAIDLDGFADPARIAARRFRAVATNHPDVVEHVAARLGEWAGARGHVARSTDPRARTA